MSKEVEIFTTGSARSLGVEAKVIVRVGLETATLTAGEWAKLISNPKRAEVADQEGAR